MGGREDGSRELNGRRPGTRELNEDRFFGSGPKLPIIRIGMRVKRFEYHDATHTREFHAAVPQLRTRTRLPQAQLPEVWNEVAHAARRAALRGSLDHPSHLCRRDFPALGSLTLDAAVEPVLASARRASRFSLLYGTLPPAPHHDQDGGDDPHQPDQTTALRHQGGADEANQNRQDEQELAQSSSFHLPSTRRVPCLLTELRPSAQFLAMLNPCSGAAGHERPSCRRALAYDRMVRYAPESSRHDPR